MRGHRETPWWVIVSDIVLFNASMVLAYWMRYELEWFRDISYYHTLSAYLPFALFFTVLMLLAFRMDQVYRQWPGRQWLDQVYRIINATAKSTVVMLAVTFVLQPLEYSRLLLVEAGLNAIVLLTISRAIQSAVVGRLRARGIGVRRAIIVGAGEIGRTVMRTVVARPGLGYHIVGFVDDNPEKGNSDIGRFEGLGPVDKLPDLIEQRNIDEVIITLPWMYHRKIMGVVRTCERRNVSAHIVPDLFQMSLSRVDVDDLGGVPLVGVRDVGFGQQVRTVKRAVDVIGAFLALTLGAPCLGLIAAAIRLDSPGPIIFRQTRVGVNGRLFKMYKFRSMYEGAEQQLEEIRDLSEVDGPIFKMRDDPRVTRVGRMLRRFSIDELPQFWNVLLGDMSLVGPRPPLPSEVKEYVEWHKKRLEVRPGVTGLWQVSGRSLLSFDEQCLLDIYYIENWSLWLDFKILVRTIPEVLFGNGAY
ncbi:MAG: undecaprenyl-phosphate glucose phosphotransferase [Anaerolineae bacterium]|jgi:exopolysaccharide biosynthesis polyprenyl glycosylphosphotransferase